MRPNALAIELKKYNHPYRFYQKREWMVWPTVWNYYNSRFSSSKRFPADKTYSSEQKWEIRTVG
jgi:hypothetical protein